jgi:hypothetical protein
MQQQPPQLQLPEGDRFTLPTVSAVRELVPPGGQLAFVLDGRTGKPRTVIDIERAARLCVKEGPLRFAPYESRPDRACRPRKRCGWLSCTGGRLMRRAKQEAPARWACADRGFRQLPSGRPRYARQDHWLFWLTFSGSRMFPKEEARLRR